MIIRINKMEGYKISCLFHTGESRTIDFKAFFRNRNIGKGHHARPLLADLHAFQQVEILDGTLTWKNIEYESTDEQGRRGLYYFDLDPKELYLAGIPDEDDSFNGTTLKKEREKLGLSIGELAKKTQISAAMIRQIEAGSVEIGLGLLKKIVKEGFEKRLEIRID